MKLAKNLKRPLLIIAIISFLIASYGTANAFDQEAIRKYNKGIDLSKTGEYKEAAIQFKESVALDPTFVDAYYNLGAIYEYLGETDNALNAFMELFNRNPNDNEAAFKIASIYYNKGNYNKALIYIRQVQPDYSKYADAQALTKKINYKISQQNQINNDKSITKITNRITYKDFQGPTGITKDSKGNIYVANFSSNSIIQISPDNKRKIIAKGKPISGPIGLVADSADNIYIANYMSSEIVKISPDGKISKLYTGIKRPYYLYIDNLGTLYISEQGTNTVIKLKP